MKLIKGDSVKIVRGKDLGKTGKVVRVIAKESKVLVEGINQYKRHVKARSQNQKSEIITITKPLHIGSVMLLCPKCNLPTRVGYKTEKERKSRICKKCEQII